MNHRQDYTILPGSTLTTTAAFLSSGCHSLTYLVSSDRLWSFTFTASVAARSYSHGKQETDEEFDARWVTYFNKPDIDAWELRKGG